MITLGKTKISKIANSIVLVGLIIYALSKMGFLFSIEVVYKVDISQNIINQMGGIKIKNDIDTFIKDYSKNIPTTKMRESFLFNYILNEHRQVTQIEILTSNNFSAETRSVALQFEKDLQSYVDNQMLQEYLAGNTIMYVNFPQEVIQNLSNDEKQALIQEFFASDNSIINTNSEKLSKQVEFKLIVDGQNRIWEIEILSKLPRNEAVNIISPIHKALQSFVDTEMVKKASEINGEIKAKGDVGV